MMQEEPIGRHEAVTNRRQALRVRTMDDPVLRKPEAAPEEDGSIRVTDDDMWAPQAFDYQNNSWKGAKLAAEGVAKAERIAPDLDVGAEKLDEHRKAMRDLTRR